MSKSQSEQLTWFLRRDGRQAGPFTSAKVRRLLLDGQVKLDDEVSRDRKHWTFVHSVAEVVPPQMRAGGESIDPVKAADRSIPWPAIVISLCLLASLLLLAVYLGGGIPDAEPDCEADPRPGVDWRNCRMPGRQLSGLDLRTSLLQNTDLSGGKLAGADLSQAILDYAGLRQADMAYVIMVQASARGADLRQADLSRADFTGADLSFADLTQANLNQVKLDDAELSNTIWVDGKVCAQGSKGKCLIER